MCRILPVLILASVISRAAGAEKDPFAPAYEEYRAVFTKSLMDGVLCTSFSYIGTLSVGDAKLPVFVGLTAIDGMLAPRGEAELLVFHGTKIVARFSEVYDEVTPPLRCEGNRVVLFGRTRSVPQRTSGRHHNGNVLAFTSPTEWDLLDERIYGSSGGVDATVPTDEQREREVRDATDPAAK